jgi:glycosyltransferase 2 family protein
MSRLRAAIKPVLSLLVVGLAVVFFVRAFERNWTAIRAQQFRVDGLFLSFSFVATIATLLLATYAWHLSVNSFLPDQKLTLRQSVAAVNSSGLTKYIPGKIWSYALQLYWLSDIGISKSVVVYINLLNLLVSMLTAVILGLVCLIFSTTTIPLVATLPVLALLLLFDIVWVKFDAALLGVVISTLNKAFRKNMAFLGVPGHLLVGLHLVHGAANVISGCSAYFVCRAIGYHPTLTAALLVIAATLISDVIGFLAFLVPGGLGVREGIMYVLLTATGPLALVLPLVSRAVSMLADVGVGALALKLLRGFLREIQSQKQSDVRVRAG